MSLTSYRAAPPRATISGDCRFVGLSSGFAQRSDGAVLAALSVVWTECHYALALVLLQKQKAA
jgi:hypothetical protein